MSQRSHKGNEQGTIMCEEAIIFMALRNGLVFDLLSLGTKSINYQSTEQEEAFIM